MPSLFRQHSNRYREPRSYSCAGVIISHPTTKEEDNNNRYLHPGWWIPQAFQHQRAIFTFWFDQFFSFLELLMPFPPSSLCTGIDNLPGVVYFISMLFSAVYNNKLKLKRRQVVQRGLIYPDASFLRLASWSSVCIICYTYS